MRAVVDVEDAKAVRAAVARNRSTRAGLMDVFKAGFLKALGDRVKDFVGCGAIGDEDFFWVGVREEL